MATKLNTTTSIVDYLKSIGQDSSLANRQKLGKDYGIDFGSTSDNYATQNSALLKKLSAGTAPSYTSEVKNQLGEYNATPSTIANTGEKPADPYGISTIRTDIDTYKSKLDESMQKLKTIQTDTYDQEYSKRNLGATKDKIASIDAEIATAKSERDAAIAKVRGNSGLSAAQMTGDIKKLADFQNTKINNLIDQRNSTAGEYNASLSEIDRIVGAKQSEAKTEYDYYAGLLDRADTGLASYQKELSSQLKDTQTQSNWEKELAQALQIANIKAADSPAKSTLQLVRDPRTGDPLYWFDPATQDISWVDQGGGGSSGGTGFDNIGVETPAMKSSPAAPAEQSWLRKLLPW